jgi:DNA-binding NarL/FixJ family response regulator
MKNVFIVDDHTAIREGYKVILERSGRFKPQGEAPSAEEALESLAAAGAAPDFFIIDISLPGMSGLELTTELRRRYPEAKVAIVSMHRRYDYIVGAFRAGATGYLSKDAGAESIVAALDSASRGDYYLDHTSLKLFIDEVISLPGKATAGKAGISGLSERETEVLQLLAEGKRADEIASELDLSQKTVENHLSNITGKLGARDRFELYRVAARLGKS